MPKNTTGGKKHKRAKNSYGTERKLVEGDNEFQFYGRVNKKLGGGRFSIDVFIPEKKDFKTNKIIRVEEIRKEQIALLRGSLKKKCRIMIDGIVLVSLREFEIKKVDIIHYYKHEEVVKLINQDILPKCKLFENSDNEEIKFNELEIDTENKLKEINIKEQFISNYDLIPNSEINSDYDSDSDSDYEIENI